MRSFLLRRLAAVPLILLVLSFLVFAATQVRTAPLAWL